jgi:hypothetical protein
MTCPRSPRELLAEQGFNPGLWTPGVGFFNHPPLFPTLLPPPSSHWGAWLEPPVCPSQDFDLLVVSLVDENDNHPLFTKGTYQAEVMENSPAGRCQAHPGAPVIAKHGQGLKC